MGSADATAQTPFSTYGTTGTPTSSAYNSSNAGSFVAPINQTQQSGITNTNTAAGEAQPYYGAATGTLGSAQAGVNPVNSAAEGLAGASAEQVNPTALTGSDVNQYLSPYLGDVLGTTNALANQNNSIAQSGALGTAINSGAFGGDRTGIAAANLNQQNSLAEQATDANILNTGYNTALGTAQQQQGVNLSAGQANRAALGAAGSELAGIGSTAYGEGANTASEYAALGSGAQTAGLQGASAQIGAGTLEQQTQQAQDTAQYNQFLQQESYPFQVESWLGSLAEGTGALSGSTTTTQQPGGFFSDRHLKHDIKKIGKTYDGQEIYSYKMHGDNRTHIGLIAQKVEKKHPEAVGLAGGYKIVDYGRATEEAANRGHFREGGVVPIRRRAYAAGGSDGSDPYDYLAMQRQMYAPQNQQRNIPSQTAQSHQLAVASGSPTPPPSGASNLNSSMGLINNGQRLYKQFSSPSSGSGVSPGMSAAPDMSESAISATAPAADSSTASGLASAAPAAEAAAPAAAEAAAPAAASAAVPVAADAGAEAAAALAAEYAAADVGVAALAAAKRGGAIKRKGYDAGGMPYMGTPGAGTPYAADNGTMDIPDDANTAKLQTAGPIKKQPTGLQTMLTMSDPNSAAGIAGSIFSNQGLGSARGGRKGAAAGGRRGYDDGGDVTDSGDGMQELTVEGERPDPVAYEGGVAPVAPEKIDLEAAPIVAGLKASEPDAPSAPTDHWWKHSENVVPLLQGLAAMGTAPTKHLGVALAAGLGAGAQSWLPAQQQEADIQQRQLQNQMTGMQVGAMRGAMSGSGQGAPAATPYGAPPTDAGALPAYYAQKYNPTMTPQELTRYNSAQVAGGFSKNPGLAQAVMTDYQQRVGRQQQDAIQQHDAAYDVATRDSGNFAALKTSDPVAAAAISKSLGFDAASKQIPPAADDAAKQYATDKVTAIHPWTGASYKDDGGTTRDTRTGKPAIGVTAQQLTAEQKQQNYQQAVGQANETVTTGAGLPTLRYKSLGYPSDDAYARHVTGGIGPQVPGPQAGAAPPAAAAPPQRAPAPPPRTVIPPRAPPQTPAAPQSQMLSGVNLNAIPRLPPLPAAVDQPTKARADERATSDVKIQNDSMGALSQQASDAARNTAIYSQLEKTLANADPREFGPSSSSFKALANLKTYLNGLPPDGLVNQAEVDKYLSQLGVGGSKQLLGAGQQLRQQEMLLLMSHANPNMDQPLQVIKNLAAYGRAGNEYDFKAANTGIAAIRGGADPYQVPGAIEAQSHRADFVNSRLSSTTPQTISVRTKSDYDALPRGTTYIHNGKTGVKQ
jgi:hypothetical protein